MSVEELNIPIPGIKPEDQPDIIAYSLLKNFVADLSPRPLSPGFGMWVEFRYRSTGETNHARWSKTVNIGDKEHSLGVFGVQGERPGGKHYSHSALRCSCCLPDYKSYRDLDDEYQECPAQNLIIQERVEVYKNIIGESRLGSLSEKSLQKAVVFILDMTNKTPLAWPPSNRSDRILVQPLAEVFGVSQTTFNEGIQDLVADNVVQLHGDRHPAISIAA